MNIANNQGKKLGEKFGTAVFCLLLVVILLSAIPNGTADDWVVSVCIFLLCVCAALRIFESFITQRFEIAEPLLLSPLFGILLLALLQLMLSTGSEESLANTRIFSSGNHFETQKFVLTFFGMILTAEMLFHYTTTRRRMLTLVCLVLTVGVGSALFGILRHVFAIDDNIVLKTLVGNNAGYAQFINRNHFAFLMEMTLGVIVGLLLKAKLTDGIKLVCGMMAGLVLFALISANSRGAIVSLSGLGLFAVFTHFITRREMPDRYGFERTGKVTGASRLKTVAVALVVTIMFTGVALLTIVFVGGDPVVRRIETIQSEMREFEDNKMQRSDIWESSWKLVERHPISGVGFGGYGTAITAVDSSNGTRSLQQAHNDYLEVLANGGVIAFGMMLTFLGLVIFRICQQFNSRSSLRGAVSFGSAVGIFGVMLHSVVDFGLHVIVNALILLVLVVLATARIPIDKKA